MLKRIPADWRWIILGGLALTALLFYRGCLGQVPSPTGLTYQWYPWSEDRPEGCSDRTNPILFDGAAQVYPWYLFAREEVRAGRLPLWNPYAACGVPHAANPVTAVFSPFSVPLWILPFSVALLLVHAAKVFLAWLFMAIYLRHRGLRLFETLLGSAAFALSGYVILWLFWHHSSTFLWLPLLFLWTDRIMDGAGRRDVVLLGITTGLCILSGHVETAFHNAAAVGCYAGAALLWRVARRRTGPGAAILAALRLTLGAALGVALSAVLVIPFLEYLRESHILQVRSGYPANPFWYPPSLALALLVPNFLGSPGTGSYWFPGGTYIELGQGYFGVVPFVLFLLGACLSFLRRDAFGIGLSLLALVCLGVVFGIPPFFHVISSLPGFRVSANSRLLSITVFTGVVLGARALRIILQGKKEDRSRIVSAAILAGGGVLFILVLFPFAAVRRPEMLVPGALDAPVWFEGPPRWMAAHLLLCLGLAGGFFLLLGLFLSGKIGGRWFRRMLAAMILGDLLWFAMPFNPMVPPGEIYPPTAATGILEQKDRGTFRVLGTPSHLPVGTNIPYHLEDIRGYDAMGLARYEDLRRVLAGEVTVEYQEAILNRPLLNFLNVRYLIQGHPPGGMHPWPTELGSPAGQILPSAPLGQTFVAPGDELSGVAFLLATYDRVNRGPLRFHLFQGGPDGEEVATGEVEMSAVEDNRWKVFTFPPISRSLGKTYYAYLESPEASPGNAITAWISSQSAYAPGTIHRSHRSDPEGDLCIVALTSLSLGLPGTTTLPIYENHEGMPRAFLVRKVRLAGGREESLRWIRESAVDLKAEVILDAAGGDPATLEGLVEPRPDGEEEGRVRIVSYLPGEVKIEIEANPAPAVLVMSDTFYPGWKAILDETEIPILRANHAFRAVPIGAGDHTLVFRFVPSSTRWGIVISLVAVLVTGALLVLLGAGPRRTTVEAPPSLESVPSPGGDAPVAPDDTPEPPPAA